MVAFDPVTFTCVADSQSGGTPEGGEIFQVAGKAFRGPLSPEWDGTRGSGTGQNITVANSQNLITNGEFENFTSNVPDGWTVSSGTAGTSFGEETSTVHRGVRALKGFSGQNWQLDQIISANAFNRDRRYFMSAWSKVGTLLTAGGFNIDAEIVGGASVMDTAISVSTTNDSTTYTLYTGQMTIPDDLDNNIRIKIDATGTAADQDFFIDGLVLAPVEYFHGTGYNIVAGGQKFLHGDTLQMSAGSGSIGVFQRFFIDYYGVQLPDNASPTIADSLAT